SPATATPSASAKQFVGWKLVEFVRPVEQFVFVRLAERFVWFARRWEQQLLRRGNAQFVVRQRSCNQ
ncbi:MAG: hypothetical protein ACUVQK_12915, partial [Thermogutta sp.]